MNYKLVQKWSSKREIETYIVEWVKEKRSLSLVVTNYLMASEIMRRFPDSFTCFEHCHKWTYSMMERNGLSIGRKTHNQIRSEENEMGEIHLDFIVHFKRLREFHSIPYHLCDNMDETECYFDAETNRTVHLSGKY